MSSRTQMRQQMQRQRVMEEEKSQVNILPRSSNDAYNCYKTSHQPLSYNSNYLPSLSHSISGTNQNVYFENCMNNSNSLSFNPEITHNCFEFDDYIQNTNDFPGSIRNHDSPYMVSSEYTYDKFNLHPYSEYPIENKIDSTKYPRQYPDITNQNLLPSHDNSRNELSLSCPVTGEQSDISLSHVVSSCNFPPTPSSSQGPFNNDDRRNSTKDRSKKESHNRIERKRRDFINQQIIELSRLIPPQMLSDGESKKNKGNILKNSVEYITYLKNETENTQNYIKETDLAFMLIENYRRRNQELEQQMKTFTSQVIPMSQDLTMVYNNYITLHEQNLKLYQSNPKFSTGKSAKSNISDVNRRLGSSNSNKQQLSPLDNSIAFKKEPSSAHSSVGNNSITTYRIEEEVDDGFNSVQQTLPLRHNYQNSTNNHPSLPSMHSDSFFSSNAHYRCIETHKYESMEC